MRRLVVTASCIGGALLALLALPGCGGQGADGAGWRVDDRDMADECTVGDQQRCTGAGFPRALVDVPRRQVLVVWDATYAPLVDEVYARILDESGEPQGDAERLGDMEDVDAPLNVAPGADGTYLIAWDGRVRTYSAELELLSERPGRLPRWTDPNIGRGWRGRPLVRVPGGEPVVLLRSTDWQIRSVPEAEVAELEP